MEVKMADSRKPDPKAPPANLKPDSTIADFVDPQDPNKGEVPDLFIMRGWLGNSATAGVWRLYQNHACTEWFEIDQTDIWQVKDDPDGDGSIVWVARGARM